MKGFIKFTLKFDVEIPDPDTWSWDDTFTAIAEHFAAEAERLKTATGPDRWPEGTDGMDGTAVRLGDENDRECVASEKYEVGQAPAITVSAVSE